MDDKTVTVFSDGETSSDGSIDIGDALDDIEGDGRYLHLHCEQWVIVVDIESDARVMVESDGISLPKEEYGNYTVYWDAGDGVFECGTGGWEADECHPDYEFGAKVHGSQLHRSDSADEVGLTGGESYYGAIDDVIGHPDEFGAFFESEDDVDIIDENTGRTLLAWNEGDAAYVIGAWDMEQKYPGDPEKGEYDRGVWVDAEDVGWHGDPGDVS